MAREQALRDLAALRPQLEGLRLRARLACMASPMHWLAIHGVPLNTYLAQIDELDALCQKAEAELQEQTGDRGRI
jgi:hypothetical protein